MLYVIAYDIPDDARRLKLAKVLEGFGQRVQRSVFECDLTEREYRALLKKVERVIKLDEGDSVRIYRLCSACATNVEVKGEGLPVEKSNDFYVV
ncbi:MAG: CRISPR-associated endonuclease Cas2 [Roseiflexus sp.]|nr:CRISPR-associated endonuclease Cas2 [Roseiflexus sp.]MDW8146400.1 CRISPR-associated endonuclease Cas2 [Roseiflexaceae bacterium]